jgi:hypothetical protein
LLGVRWRYPIFLGFVGEPIRVIINKKTKTMATYYVKYKVNNTTTGTNLQLQAGSESEAIAKLKQQRTVSKDASVIILSIEKK